MTVTDVNAQFEATKLAQMQSRREARDAQIAALADRDKWLDAEIAAGRAQMFGENRVRVTQGWDAGEYFTLNRNAAGQIQEIIAEHGLDLKANGEVALFSSVPAWHKLGQVIENGTADVETVLDLAGLNYNVVVQPSYHMFNGEVRPSNLFATVRDDTGEALGAVGEGYTVIDNREAFHFMQDLVDNREMIWESAGSMRGGRRVFISARLPEDIVVDAEGIADIVRPFLAVFNSHDGTTSYRGVVTPWRPVCQNTERFALRDAATSWSIRHTRFALSYVQEARRSLGLTRKYYENWAEESTQLARTPMSNSEFDAFIRELYPLDEENPKKQAIAADEKRRAILHDIFNGPTTETCRNTAYAARCAMTEYLDFIVPTRARKDELTGLAARAERILGDDLNDTKSRVHKKLLTLKTR